MGKHRETISRSGKTTAISGAARHTLQGAVEALAQFRNSIAQQGVENR
jgi:hypothetical protein